MISSKLQVITSFFKVKHLKGCIELNEAFGTRSTPLLSTHDRLTSRQREYFWCILQNAFHPYVERLHLLVEDHASMEILRSWEYFPALMASGKAHVCIHNEKALTNINQIHYSDLFRLANNVQKSYRGEYTPALVVNSDIYIPSEFRGLKASLTNFLQKGGAFALTRWEEDGSGPLIDDYHGSHDGFVFVPGGLTFKKCRENNMADSNTFDTFLRSIQHPQNTYQGENIVIHELSQMLGNENVRNPCYAMQLKHKHNVAFRQWLVPTPSKRTYIQNRYGLCPPSQM